MISYHETVADLVGNYEKELTIIHDVRNPEKRGQASQEDLYDTLVETLDDIVGLYSGRLLLGHLSAAGIDNTEAYSNGLQNFYVSGEADLLYGEEVE